jgi:tetratricopeptide (TPR) repeat protein
MRERGWVWCLRLPLLLFVGLVAAVACCLAQDSIADSWHKLIDSKTKGAAQTLCTGWLKSADVHKRTEAHKCLANVALLGNDVISLQGNDVGGGYLGPGYTPEAIDAALTHLNEALKLSPQDLRVHQGRLHLLEVSLRYEEMAMALDESCTTYRGPNALEDWLPYIAELFESGQLRADIELLKVLEKHYPNSHEVMGDFGAVYLKLKEDAKAMTYLQRAVELAPDDPIDSWNLARSYDFADNSLLAEQWYQKSLSLERSPEQRKINSCVYGKFVEQKLKNTTRACELEKMNCEVADQTACAAK